MLNKSIDTIKGVGVKTSALFNNLDIHSTGDLIEHYPVRYLKYNKITKIEECQDKANLLIKVKVSNIKKFYSSTGKLMVNISAYDDTGEVKISFLNAGYITNLIKVDKEYYFAGVLNFNKYGKSMFFPIFKEYYKSKTLEEIGFGIIPIYSKTKGLSDKTISKIIENFINHNPEYVDIIPSDLIKKRKLLNYFTAIKKIHFPKTDSDIELARKTLIYNEFFNYRLKINNLKVNKQKSIRKNHYEFIKSDYIESFFPFDFTISQKTALSDIQNDLYSNNLMSRLLYGDVGSGKTAVAISASIIAAESGKQIAIMAPTEILAMQHYESFRKILKGKYNIVILKSKMKEKKKTLDMIKSGDVDIIIGTSALIQDAVEYNSLSLIITDEQHRFGVKQRDTLKKKAKNDVDILLMSATPIPRTLSMLVYGNLDLSIMEDMPVGREKIHTQYVPNKDKYKLIQFIKDRLELSEKVYFVAPRIEDDIESELKSVQELYENLKRSFTNINISMLHGRLKANEKEKIMNDFMQGSCQILVSTTVVEVGIDVKDATIIVILNAERYGLSQLHQLRGRVGRGDKKSYCFLLVSLYSEKVKERIKAMVNESSGFKIAEKDLELRGPGDVFGTIQHGFVGFKLGDMISDIDLLKTAFNDADEIFHKENKE